MIKIQQFKKYLSSLQVSENTKISYMDGINCYRKYFNNINSVSLQAFKGILISKYKPETINLRLGAMNKYLDWEGHPELKLAYVRIQKKTFLENVISMADYKHLCKCLKADGLEDWYFLIRFLACTGARISEALKFKGEAVSVGYFDIYGKGGKVRRIYIPKPLLREALNWKTSGLLFPWSTATVDARLKDFSKKYHIDTNVMHCHSFRHLFGKQFIDKYKDLALLADLMGHESIETTRIYLRRTSAEQMAIVNKVVTW